MNHVYCWISKAVVATLFLALAAGTVQAATAASSPEVVKGLAWLQGQVQPTGALANEAISIATPIQNRSEALQALKLLATIPVALTDQLAANTEDNTEYLSRRAVTLSLAGRDASAITALLVARQNLDGGFGGAKGVESNAQDTAWVMLAMSQNALSATPVAQTARSFLLGNIQPDGGVGVGSDSARISANALALLALQMFPSDLNTATALKQIDTWLLLKQKADGSWLSDSYLTALSLAAVSPLVSDPAIRTSARTYLTKLQAADGSWGGDPFLTAVVLRALAFESVAQVVTSSIIGQVIDQNTATALAGATVALSGASTATVTTMIDGKLNFANLVAGSYTLQVSKAGYIAYSKNYQLNAGQALNVGSITLGQTQSTGIVRGQIIAAATGRSISGVTVQLNGGAASAVTDVNGLYEFVSIPPGIVTLSATVLGYAPSSGTGTVLAGQTLIFSPALYATGATAPTTGHFTGKAIAAGSGAPLAGVSIQLNGIATGVTAVDGSFDLILPPASYNATFTLTGYGSATTGFLLTAGTTVNAGTIALAQQLTSTTISGIIKDVVSGKPINGAKVQVLNGLVATTGADGAYSLGGLLGTSFDLRVSAIGYVSQQVQLQLSAPSAIIQDFPLQVQTGAGLSLDPLLVSPGSAASRTDISVGATVTNAATGAAVSAVLTMQVVNAQGKVVSNAIAYDKVGANLLGVFSLNPSQQLPVMFRWNTGQFPAGTYSLIARVVEAGSMSTTTPLGRVLTEAQGTLTITADQHFGGTITVDPPVLQINTNTPVHLSAILANDGNADMPAQAYQLRVIDEKTGTVVATQQMNGNAFSPSALQSLSFADWMPAASGGNYRVELQALTNATLGKVIGKVYVGDAARAAFTVNKLVVPAGTQAVRGTIKVTGQDATQGTISDPLAPLIKAAVQKAVTYNDAQAANWYASGRCLGCHVVSQALVGGEMNRNITTFNATQRNTLFNALVTSQKPDGSLDMSHPMFARTQTILGLWALNSWHNKSEVAATSMKAAKYLLGQQNSDGSWTADHMSGWWITNVANTGLTTKSLVEVDELIKQVPVSAVPMEYSSSIKISGGIIPGAYKGAAVDAAGNIYLTTYMAGTLTLVKPDGTQQVLLSGLTGPRPPVFGADGALYIPSDVGVIRYTLAGQKTLVTTIGATGVALGPDGNIYACNHWNHKITKITPTGVVSDFIVGGALYYPHGIIFDQTGALLVANAGNWQILKYAAGQTTAPTAINTNGAPYSFTLVGNDVFVATSNGLVRYNSALQPEIISSAYVWSLAKTPDGKILTGSNLPDLLLLTQAPMQLPTLGAAITKSTNWLLVDTNITMSNNLDLAHRLIGLGTAKRYFAGTAMATTIQAKMDQVAAALRSRQRIDGGWAWTTGHTVSDSMVTAQVGVALDYLHPSPKDPVVQKAINLLLNRQQADGSWMSENSILSTRLAATTWVAIWLPIALDRIGGIDTDLTVSMPANVSLTNPDLAPTSSVANAIGGTDYVWKLQGVTSAGRDINFDLSLANMALGENRPVAADSYLTFNNSFTQVPVKAPVSVPRVTASAFLNLGVTTDKISYSANMPVNITAAVNNTSVGLLDGSVKLEIFDTNNFRTAVVGTQPFTGLIAGTQQSLSATWNSGGTIAGGYYVLATLYDAQNRQVGTAKSVFDIVPSGVGGVPGISGVGATVTVDKISYLPFDALRISGRVTNLTQNQVQSNLQAVVNIYRPDGTVLWTQTSSLQQLAVGGFIDLGFGSQLSAAAAGKYRVTLSVQSIAGVQVATSETTFDVLSSALTGSGLKGQITALPKIVPQTDPVILDGSISNLGNADITALPVTVSIVNPATQQVMTQWTYTANVVRGQPFQTAISWDTDPTTVGSTYVAVLTATVGGKQITLGQDTFTVTDPPVKLDVTQSTVRENRVLVWLACAAEEIKTEEGRKTTDGKKATDNKSRSLTSDDDKKRPKPVPQCIQTRTAFLQGLLTSYNVPYLITSNRDDFRKAFRDGRYNVYWISGAVKAEAGKGKADKEEDGILKEVREAVYRGDSLILDGDQSEYSEALQEAAGVEYSGRLSTKNSAITTSGLMFSTAHIQTLGAANKLRSTTGAVQATFDLPVPVVEHGEHADDHTPTPPKPQSAIVGNAYGRGQALAFGFDLVNNLQNGSGMAAWNGVLLTGLTNLLPPLPDKYSGAAYVTLSTQIKNLAKRASDLVVTAHLPSGTTLLNTVPTSTVDTNGYTVWSFNLPVATTKPLLLNMRLPLLSGTHVLPITVDSVRRGKSRRYGEYSFNWTVIGSDRLLSQVVSDLQLLVLKDEEELEARNKAVLKLQQAATFITQLRYADALESLLAALDKLHEIRSVDVGSQRVNIDRLLQETGWNWLSAAGL